MIYNNIHKHYIIKALEEVFVDFPGGIWADHFVVKNKYYRVKTEPSNNGNFTAHDATGCLKHFNTIYNNIIAVYPR